MFVSSFQTYPRGVEVSQSIKAVDAPQWFQTYPRGVEVSCRTPVARPPDGFRRTLVGLKSDVEYLNSNTLQFQTYPRGVEVG